MPDAEKIAELRSLAAAVGAIAEVQQLHTRLLQLILTAATEVTPSDESRPLLERIAAQLDALASKVDALTRPTLKKR